MIKINSDFLAGAVVGFGAGLATRALPDEGNGFLRNLTKNTIKWGIVSANEVKTQLAKLKETVEDLAAEAQVEAAAVPEPTETTQAPAAKTPRTKVRDNGADKTLAKA